MMIPERVDVLAEAGDMELAQGLDVGRIAQVDGVERISLLEGDHVTAIADEAHRLDRLPLFTERVTAVQDGQLTFGTLHGEHAVFYRVFPVVDGGGDAQHPVRLIQRELVERHTW